MNTVHQPVAPSATPDDRLAVPSTLPLRIATLCSMDHGGAGTGTQRRVEALRQNGVEARIYSLVVKSTHSYVERVIPEIPGIDLKDQGAIWDAVRQVAIQPAKKIPGFCASDLFSLPESVVDFRAMQAVFDSSDLIHLHWVVGMLDLEHAVEAIGDKPVVWTLADMNAFTGGCHYSEGCEEFKRECRSCPLLGGQSDLAHQVWRRKKAAYEKIRNLHIICPSRWIAERVSASSLLGDRPIHHIPNAFPVERFSETNKLVARLRLGLPLNKKLILFGADALGNKRKGGEVFGDALMQLEKLSQSHDVMVILFGNSTTPLPLPSRSLGYVSDDLRLALIYSAADVFVSPSDEDSGPMTVGESMLCGTPVVSFKVGIALELIDHEKTGYLANRGDPADLAKGILWALNADRKESLARAQRCRARATRFHDPEQAAKRHIEVYEQSLNS
jgi:glycosyltransferase involved in cell wall biosynthesis